ncbi:penicillin-binding protein 2 [Marininema mesophilum]|uniref:Penicillin-binding protein 2 n=1 Tax=Marininema mesophilum TaxID=1048340 RepID=A0A1H2VHM9_9BACL|nr:penicillin-binding transpeptidase domain-containing protein [Marininema mesophilum]SDW67720.1 penicillin-binding protein 2 [Marininema mesophilum]
MLNSQRRGTKEKERTLHRLHALWLTVFLLFVALLLRLSWVQLSSGEKYHDLAAKNNFKQIPIVAPRGNIYDRGGKLLVGNQPLYTAIYLETDQTTEQKLAMANKLATSLGMPRKDVLKSMDVGLDTKGKQVPRKQPPYYPKKIKDRLTEKEVARLSEHPSEFKGVNVILEPLREYRKDSFAVQTIGYVRPFQGAKTALENYKRASKKSNSGDYLDWEQVGMDGLEYSYQDQLRGKNGYRIVRVNSSGKVQEVIKKVNPRSGNKLYTTLDEKMQSEGEKKVQQHLSYLRNQAPGRDRSPYARNAYAVAMEVKTGRIRSMISYPDYDPDIWNGAVTAQDYKKLTYSIRNGTITEAPYDARNAVNPDKEYRRHPLSVLPLGSTFKPMMALMALDKGLISPYTSFKDPGAFYYASSTPPIRNSSNHNYGMLNVKSALAKSANTFFTWVGSRWYHKEGKKSIKEFQKYTHQFGLGSSTGVPLKGESNGTEDYVSIAAKNSGLSGMVLASFGQAQRYSAMQLAQFTATVANNGKRMTPQLVEKIGNKGSDGVIKPKVMNTSGIDASHFQTVKDGMVAVTQPGGTASHLFKNLPFKVAAKTGTSEQDIPGRGRVENSVFLAFAPANDPKIAVAVIVPEGGYGGKGAGPIVENLITNYYERFMKTKQ